MLDKQPIVFYCFYCTGLTVSSCNFICKKRRLFWYSGGEIKGVSLLSGILLLGYPSCVKSQNNSLLEKTQVLFDARMCGVIRTKSPKDHESSWPSNNKKEKAAESRNLEEVVGGGGPVARLLLPKPNTSGSPPPPYRSIFRRKRINCLSNTL